MVLGPATGRPKSAVFRTADVVGIDTLVHVARHCHEALTNDERRDVFAVHPVLEELVKRKWLGSKTRPGLLQEAGRRDPAARPQDLRVRAPEEAALPLDRRHQGGGRRRRAAAADGGRGRSGGGPRPRGAVRDPGLLGGAPARDRRRRGRDRSGHALGLRLGSRPLRDLGRPGGEGHGREDAGRRASRCPSGCRPAWPRARIASTRRTSPGRLAQLRRTGGYADVAADPRVISLDALRAGGQGGRAQRQRLAPGPRRRRVLPRVPRQDERHRSATSWR